MMKALAVAFLLGLICASAFAETDVEKAWAACTSQGLIINRGFKPGYENCPAVHSQLTVEKAADTAARDRAATAAAQAAATNEAVGKALIESLIGK